MTAATTAGGAVPGGHVQVPRSLLYSAGHGALAVWVWSTYETLMPHGIGGGRAPAMARRRVLAEAAGTSTTALDDARRELLAAPGGPFLSRSAPRGAKRSVKHAALRLPRQTGERYAPVPAWTLDRVWAGRRRPAGRISADAWRLYAACVDRACRAGASGGFDATVGGLANKLGVSAATARRRLAELERTGLAEVAERRGGWLILRPILDPAEADQAAEIHAREGRCRLEARADPAQIAALTSDRKRQSPLAGSGTSQESPCEETPGEESKGLPAAGGKIRRTHPRAAAGAGKPNPHRRKRRQVSRAAAEVYRSLPGALAAEISEHGSRRVLEAIAAELPNRTPAELTDRIARNWRHWQARLDTTEPLRDPVAVAVRLAHRGLACPDVRCEDGHQLDLDAACKACALTAAERAHTASTPDQTRSEEPPRRPLRREPATGPVPEEIPGGKHGSGSVSVAAAAETGRVDGRRYGALARALLKARTAAERDAILTGHQVHTRTA